MKKLLLMLIVFASVNAFASPATTELAWKIFIYNETAAPILVTAAFEQHNHWLAGMLDQTGDISLPPGIPGVLINPGEYREVVTYQNAHETGQDGDYAYQNFTIYQEDYNNLQYPYDNNKKLITLQQRSIYTGGNDYSFWIDSVLELEKNGRSRNYDAYGHHPNDNDNLYATIHISGANRFTIDSPGLYFVKR